MADRTVEDRLREEYFYLAPHIRRVAEDLDAELRYHLLQLSRRPSNGEQVVVKVRQKECESAIAKLRKKQEGSIFDPEKSSTYTLRTLKDLAAARVLVFPNHNIGEINEILRGVFPEWESDPFREPGLGHKYFGYCAASNEVQGEYQIVPMLLGLFWEVEHAAIYKPPAGIARAVREDGMQRRRNEVLKALAAFEDEWSRLPLDASSQPE